MQNSMFSGSHLCDSFLKSSNEIICVDNFFSGSKMSIVGPLDNPYFQLIRHDITFLYQDVDEIL